MKKKDETAIPISVQLDKVDDVADQMYKLGGIKADITKETTTLGKCRKLQEYINQTRLKNEINYCQEMLKTDKQQTDPKFLTLRSIYTFSGFVHCSHAKWEVEKCFSNNMDTRLTKMERGWNNNILGPKGHEIVQTEKEIKIQKYDPKAGEVSKTDSDTLASIVRESQLKVSQQCWGSIIDSYSLIEEITKINCEETDIKPADQAKIKSGFTLAGKVAMYLLKELITCGLNYALSSLKNLVNKYATAIVEYILSLLSGGLYLVLKIAYFVVKLVYNLYQGVKATEIEKQAEFWGNSLGLGIRLVMVGVGLAKRRRHYRRKLRRKF